MYVATNSLMQTPAAVLYAQCIVVLHMDPLHTYACRTNSKEGQELDDTASFSPREGSALLCVTGNASHLQQQLASYSFHVAIARKTSFRVIKLKSRI